MQQLEVVECRQGFDMGRPPVQVRTLMDIQNTDGRVVEEMEGYCDCD